jgi:hypothetical protein
LPDPAEKPGYPQNLADLSTFLVCFVDNKGQQTSKLRNEGDFF